MGRKTGSVNNGKGGIKKTNQRQEKTLAHFLCLRSLPSVKDNRPSGGITFISMEGYILIWRKLQDTSFYKNSYTLHLALHLLMKANHQDKKIVFNGEEVEIKRGQAIVGRKTLALETGISEGTLYDKLKILKKCDFINIKSNNRFSIITITNYESYQNPNNKKQQQKQQPANNQPTTSQHKQRM